MNTTEVRFASTFVRDGTRRAILFDASGYGREFTNRVSTNVLQDYFGSDGTPKGDNDAFIRNRAAIEELARKALAADEVNDTGGAEITTAFLAALGFEPKR